MKKRLLSALLCFALLMSVLLVACAEDDSDSKNPNSGLTQDDYFSERDDLPDDLWFDNTKIVIHGRYGDPDFPIIELGVEEETGEPINDAIWERNYNVEQRLGVVIEPYQPDSWQLYYNSVNQIRGTIQSGIDDFQIIAGWSAQIPVLSTEKLFDNLLDYEYINVDKPYWNRSIVEELQINDTLYFLCGDISLLMLQSAYSMAMNAKVADRYHITGIYDTVLNKEWTIEKLYQYSSMVYDDVNGDSKKNEGDLFGIYWGRIANDVDSFMQASQIRMTSRDENDLPYLDVDESKLNSLTEKVFKLIYQNPGSLVPSTTAEADKAFIGDRSLFNPSYLFFYTYNYRDMESDYYILPYPLYDDQQEEYSTRVADALSIWGMPITVEAKDAVTATLEAMASESYRIVTPAFFETSLKHKFTRITNEKAYKMLDIIREGIMLNFEIIYNESIGSPYHILRDLITNRSSNFASTWDTKKITVLDEMERVVENFELDI